MLVELQTGDQLTGGGDVAGEPSGANFLKHVRYLEQTHAGP